MIPKGSSLITFTVDGVEYQAEEGMTWWQFINSTYNDGRFSALDNASIVKITDNGVTKVVGYDNITAVSVNNAIKDNHIYTIYGMGGGGVE